MKSSHASTREDFETTKEDIIRKIDKAKGEIIRWIIAMAVFQVVGCVVVYKFF